ncbi:hypothetical protein QE197_10955 [Arsenophonus nasoniae]|uniref:Conserved hypothetical phage protein n=1 Tax=Arsenophonus nasoniae TaxID=638 RepID=D2TYL0_9GAMM|nr:hypothetical protein [Arsenophonus nasoniae]QBY43984.1 hypothetical protein ArsFIN_25570 [Arsenophonus nasoniae]WGM04301.1 hypothetical protein QE258_11680 [Arsenophonus nasoniae]WGM09404.1 hypothetical protein QE197_10955 [Arsenophonus nasoniae]WGM14128.1 hypothetical protein QE193_10850 [Arsenophonus nasoniae]CBA72506.1 conserved hypothetical phage protein [Arsenophonus nasoniae]
MEKLSNHTGKTFYQVVTEAINYYLKYGWKSKNKLIEWNKKLKIAATKRFPKEDDVINNLKKIYKRLVIDGGALKNKPFEGPTKITLDKIKPKLRKELDKRIFASINLIKLNREQAIEKTLQRFNGWVTSIPPNGYFDEETRKNKHKIVKSVQEIDYVNRRLAIDQGHKLTANVKYLLATEGKAIALTWHSPWRRPGYDYREDHKERDEKIYLIRGSWADEKGYLNPINGYYDEITSVGEEVNCSCQAIYIYAPQKLPDEFLTEKGKIAFKRI